MNITSELVMTYTTGYAYPKPVFVAPDKSKALIAENGLTLADLRAKSASRLFSAVSGIIGNVTVNMDGKAYMGINANVVWNTVAGRTQLFYRGMLVYDYARDKYVLTPALVLTDNTGDVATYFEPLVIDPVSGKAIVNYNTQTLTNIAGIGETNIYKPSSIKHIRLQPEQQQYNPITVAVATQNHIWIVRNYNLRPYYPFYTVRILYKCSYNMECEEIYSAQVLARRRDVLLLYVPERDKIIFRPLTRELIIYNDDGSEYKRISNAYAVQPVPLFSRYMYIRRWFPPPIHLFLDLKTLDIIPGVSLSSRRYDNYYVTFTYIPGGLRVYIRRYLLDGVDPAVEVINVKRNIDSLCIKAKVYNAVDDSPIDWDVEVTIPGMLNQYNIPARPYSREIVKPDQDGIVDVCLSIPRHMRLARIVPWNIRVIP